MDTDKTEPWNTRNKFFRMTGVLAVLKNPQYNPATSRTDNKDLDCGGRAQRRHRFPYDRLLPKAAWRFASRRSPKSVVAAQAALGLFVFIRG
jgi:hypothetical protein